MPQEALNSLRVSTKPFSKPDERGGSQICDQLEHDSEWLMKRQQVMSYGQASPVPGQGAQGSIPGQGTGFHVPLQLKTWSRKINI